jgi:Tfp pilus assembly protein PilE
MKYNQNGRSMIEMLGVLAIIGVLSVGGIMGYSKAMTKYKNNTILNGITHTINNIKTLFLQQNNVSGLSTKDAYEAGVIPDEFKPDNIANLTRVVHAYGGDVRVVAKRVAAETAKVNGEEQSDDTGDDVVYYAIQITGLPKDVAMQIATQDWGESGDLVSVNLNDGKEKDDAQQQ